MTKITKPFSRHFQFNKSDTVLGLIFVATICLTVWAVNIYRLTIIDTEYLFIVSAIGAFVGTVLIPKYFKSSYAKLWRVFLSLAIGGGTFYFGFLYLNQALTDKKIINKDFQIIKTGTLGRGRFSSCFQPYAIIDFNGTEKQLVFNCDFEKTIENYSKVSVTYFKGQFGFYVIKSKHLTL